MILIFLDAARFIGEAVESVLAQTFQDWELVLVDDGSSDASCALARRYAAALPGKIRYLEHEGHENRGMSASRNLGIARSSAPFVAFIDADDVWLPQKLAEQVAIMRAHPQAGMVFGATRYWHGWTGEPRDVARDHVWKFDFEANALVRPPFLLLVAPLGRAFTPSMSNVLVRRETFDAIGWFEEEFTGTREDTVFFAKAFYNAYAYHADACWDLYRQHPGHSQATDARKPWRQRRRERLAYYRWMFDYFARVGARDAYILEKLEEMRLNAAHPILYRLRPAYWKERYLPGLRAFARHHLSPEARRRVHALGKASRFGVVLWRRLFPFRSLRRVVPTHRDYGFAYGTPVDRHYIEGFLERHREDVKGEVLEVGMDVYTRRFGGEKVTHSEVLHVMRAEAGVTLVADLTDAPHVESNRFDCIILTQTLQCIYDFRAAIGTLHRILKPGGVLLVTMPGVAAQVCRDERPFWGDFWRWTSMAAERVFAEFFPQRLVKVEARGNVLIAMAMLDGIVIEELRAKDFEYCDPEYELVLGIRAQKPA